MTHSKERCRLALACPVTHNIIFTFNLNSKLITTEFFTWRYHHETETTILLTVYLKACTSDRSAILTWTPLCLSSHSTPDHWHTLHQSHSPLWRGSETMTEQQIHHRTLLYSSKAVFSLDVYSPIISIDLEKHNIKELYYIFTALGEVVIGKTRRV